MKPLTTVLVGNAVRVGLEVLDPATLEAPELDAVINVAAIVREEDGEELPATVEPLEDPTGRWDAVGRLYGIRFLPPAPGIYFVRVEVSGDFDAAGEGRVNVTPSKMPAAA